MAKDVIDIRIDERQWQEFIRQARQLAPEIGQRAFNATLNKGAETLLGSIRKELENRAADPTGRLSAALVKTSRRKYQPMFWLSGVGVNTGRKRDDTDGAYYWHMIEYGHRVVGPTKRDTGRRVAGLGFTLAAFHREADGIAREMTGRAKEELVKRWKRMPKSTRPDLL